MRRWPLTATGTNLLGLVKHLTTVVLGYFGETFGRPSGIDLPWYADDVEQNDLATGGRVEHWGNEPVTFHQILVHVTTETHHHAGHADILREMIDGAAGFLRGVPNLPEDGYDWPAHVARVSAAADAFR